MTIRLQLLNSADFRERVTLALPEAALEVLGAVKRKPALPASAEDRDALIEYRTAADAAQARYAEMVLGNLAAFVPKLIPVILALASEAPDSALQNVSIPQIRAFLVNNWDRLSVSFLAS